VREVEASAACSAEVLGFERVGQRNFPDGSRRTTLLRHRGRNVRLGLGPKRPQN
jgi:hypothetical protein